MLPSSAQSFRSRIVTLVIRLSSESLNPLGYNTFNSTPLSMILVIALAGPDPYIPDTPQPRP